MDLRILVERQILRDALDAAEGVSDELLDRLIEILRSHSPQEAYARVSALLAQANLLMTSVLADTILAANLAGRERVVSRVPAAPPTPSESTTLSSVPPGFDPVYVRSLLERLPAATRQQYLEAMDPRLSVLLEDQAPPVAVAYATPGQEPPTLHLPIIEQGVERLRQKRAVRYAEYQALSQQARQQAQPIAGQLTQPAAEEIHRLVAAHIGQGASWQGFRQEAQATVPGRLLDRRQLEVTFRDAVQKAYSDGQDAVLEDPIIAAAFPYEETLPIDDSRLSLLCEVVSQSGIQGTAIYRRDDPTWQRVKPPRHPNCRCGRNPLTLREAARRGIVEAQRWLASGTPPDVPAWVPMPEAALKGGL